MNRLISLTASGVRVKPGLTIRSILEPTFQICLSVTGVMIGEELGKPVVGGGVVDLQLRILFT